MNDCSDSAFKGTARRTDSQRSTRGDRRSPRPIGGIDHRSLAISTRFWSRTRRIDGGDDCWLWQGAVGSDGYGAFRVGSQMVYAHRFAWIATYGPIPDELIVRHKCDQRLCVRPSHFFLGTYASNARDCAAKERRLGGPPRSLSMRDHRYLTPAERRQICKLYESGVYSHRFLAKLYGVTKGTIAHALGSEQEASRA